MSPLRSVTIVGGGASGVMLAAQLLRDPETDIRVTLIERRGQLGRGLAYSISGRGHVVNVPARGMSAFADDPEHFWRWLQDRNYQSSTGSWTFVPRRLYGVYLEDLLTQAGESRPDRLVVLSEQAVALRETKNGVETMLANGTSIVSHSAILAVGHETQPARGKGIAVQVGSERDTPLDRDAAVLVLGSGLSMVDVWIKLAEARHRGPITVVSRNGLLPMAHRDIPPISIDPADVPFGTNLHYFTAWFRNLIHETEQKGGDWRSVVDGLRPYNQRLWQSWSAPAKRQFLRHLRPWWNVHRHRLPPDLHHGLVRAIQTGQVTLIAAEFLGIERLDDGVRATLRPRGSERRETLDIARVYDCGGVSVDVRASGNPLVQHLVQSGAARPDNMHIGLDIDENCFLIAADGTPSERVLVVGPLTRGRFFEIEAVPDIRMQCKIVAETLLR